MSFTVDDTFLMTCLRRANPNNRISIQCYDCQPFTVKSDRSFTSNIFSVSIEYERDGHPATEFFICKVPYLLQNYTSLKEIGYYDKETHMYEAVLPKLMETSTLSVAPRYYLTAKLDVLVLADLTKQGYSLADQVPWNFEQSALLLQELARFHAASVKLYEQEPAVVKAASRITLFRKSLIARAMKCAYPRLLAALKAKNLRSRVLRNFASYERKINEGDIWIVSPRVCDFNVLIHGDLKANNILLKNDGNKPISVKILDYQTCTWNSPALDLLYFYMATVDFEVFKNYHHQLLDLYLASLNERLLHVGCDRTYTKDEYVADLTGSRLYQVFVLLFVGLHDLREAFPGFYFEENFSEVQNTHEVETIRHNEMFRCRFLKWFGHFEKLAYFDD